MKLLKIILLFTCCYVDATVIVPIKQGTSTLQSFGQPIAAKVFDPASGMFFVGLQSEAGVGSLLLSVANRAGYGNTSLFTGIATNQHFTRAQGIQFLALAPSPGNTNPIIGVVIKPPTGLNTEHTVMATTPDGKTVTESPILLDASGMPNMNGSQTSGIVGLAANQFFMFPAVRPCGGNFGSDCFGGIASVTINQTNLGLTQVPAQANDAGIKAQLLDPTTPELLINNSPTIVPNTVDLYWDDQLGRLYIGLQMTTAGLSNLGVTCATGTGPCIPLIGTCQTGFYFDNATEQCFTCPSGGIFNPQSNTCQSCPPGQVFNPNIFACQIATCPLGQFFHPVNLTCVTCPTGLFFDNNTLTCLPCPNGGIFIPAIGCTSCPNGGTFDPNQGICVPGPIQCPSGMIFDPEANTCIFVEPCPPGYTFDPVDLTCVLIVPPEPFPPQPPLVDNVVPLVPVLSYAGPIGLSESKKIKEKDIRMATRVIASGGRSVIAASVDAAGVITFNDIAPDSAFAIGNTQNMVGVFDIFPDSLAINKVRVLHASTGPSYLIINGGNGTIAQVGGFIYALPLVDLGDPANPIQGTIADKTSALVNYKFVSPATLPVQMPLNTDTAVMVGTGPVTLPAGGIISDIDVVGDTVYVSIDADPSANTEGGILYSQALFDQTGKIIQWTPWTKKAIPPFTTPSTSAVSFFAVDAVTSKVWAVDSLMTTVVQTGWSNAKSTSFKPDSSLLAQLNATVSGPSMAGLDLDQSTRGFLANQSRYALFAGNGQIIFARISQSLGSSILSPQLVMTDFSVPANFLVTDLPSTACSAQTLEYARQLTGTPSNYFFAGTQVGLYVFSVGGNGFDVSTLSTLNAPPFTTGQWTLAPNISGSIIDIKTTGNTLYVLTQTAATTTTPMTSTLYAIPFETTVSAMFAPSNIFTIAQTGVGIFANIATFNSLEIISTNSTGSTEQIVLGTNNGLYESTRAGGVQAAINQADAGWQLIANTLFYYNDIAAIDNASIPVAPPTTIWPIYIADNGTDTFAASVLQQLNGTTDAGPFNFVPPLFNSINAATDPNFATLPQIINFWSDGARRLALIANIQSSCIPEEIMSLPFDTITWNITNPLEAVINDPVLNKTASFYWIKLIGASGVILVGTNKGFVALE